MYKVTIVELFNSTEVNTEKSTVEKIRYEQSVDTLDVKAVIDAVNRGSIVRKARTRRNRTEEPVETEA